MTDKELLMPVHPIAALGIRIRELDVLRGLAVLGIFLVNIYIFGLPTEVNSHPILFSNGNLLNTATWAFNEVFVTGTMRGLFSILFGASAMIFLNEAKQVSEGAPVVDRFYRRNLLLIAFGMLHAYILLWPYDVLYVYGLLGLFLFPLRKLPAWVFLLIGVLMQAFSDVTFIIDDPGGLGYDFGSGKSPDTGSQPAMSEEEIRREASEGIDMEIAFYQHGYLHILIKQIPVVVTEQSLVLYTTHVLDMGGMMMIGVALLRFGILTGQRSSRLYLLLGLLCYTIGVGSRAIPAYNIITHDYLTGGMLLLDGRDYNFARLPITIGHICAILFLCRLRYMAWLVRILAPIGRMALTSYLSQTIIAIWIFYGFGLGLMGRLERYELLYICLGVWAFQIIFSMVWLRFFVQGPMEWVWRSIIYGHIQPFRRSTATVLLKAAVAA